MKDRTIIVTGASDGIGRALALALARRGAKLALAARNATNLAEVAARCNRAGGQAVAIPTDVSQPEACRALVERTVEHFGSIDVLVNNAGISARARVDQITDLSVFEHIMRTNYLSAVYCTRYALPALVARRGLVVAVSSLQGKTGFPSWAAYSASKHAMQGFFDSLRIELRGSGVDVLVVCPGPVATDIHTRRIGRDDGAHSAPFRPPAGTMSADECARQIVRAMERRRRELLMTAMGKVGPWLKLLAPSLVDRFVADAIARFDRAGRAQS
ncbi:MAG: SDR family oxidoreductase [Deltaproteobacteria bacterium]|nr:SDR family oxidoreductase [Deltaproteobacteria bacterium]